MSKQQRWMLVGALMCVTIPAHAGDAAAGKAKSENCAQCHGDTGKEEPAIAGMAEGNFIKAMNEYRAGERKDKKMVKAAKNLSDADISDLAAYYATLK
jgi:cytochrome c553